MLSHVYRRALMQASAVADLVGEKLAADPPPPVRRQRLEALRTRADMLRRQLLPDDEAACHQALRELEDARAFLQGDRSHRSVW